jgi:Brp/Blh family beta-carotene 15,15'-monooxygenase
LQELTSTVQGFQTFALSLNAKLFVALFALFTLLTIIMLLINILKKRLTAEQFALELIVFTLILFSFYVFPLIIGFTLYFSILHSLKVLQEEYKFVEKLYDRSLSFLAFGKLLFPYTTISVFGMGIIYLLSELNFLPELSFGYLLLILISSITLPHAFVMDRFYKKKQKPIN